MCTLARRLFVVAAHPDDDAIGCGGKISNVARAGGAVSRDLSDPTGAKAIPAAAPLRRMRCASFANAKRSPVSPNSAVTSEPSFFRLPDSGLRTLQPALRSDARRRLAAAIVAFEPDLIVAPWRRDPHADHVVAGELALEAARDANYTGEFAGYEIWLTIRGSASDMPQPHEVRGVAVALDAEAMDAKRRAILAHRSQTTGMIDDPNGFRIDEALIARWVTPVEPLLYEYALRPAASGAAAC